jgi:hypothetical protein
LEVRVGEWAEYYNNHRSNEAIDIDNVTRRDKYFGRLQEILEHRKKTKNGKSIQIYSIIIQINSIIILYTPYVDTLNLNYRANDLEENNTDVLNQYILLDKNPNN